MAAKPRFPRPPLDPGWARSARARLARCLAVAGLVAGSTALLAPAAGATFPGENGRIVFADAGHIVSMNPNGSDRRQLTNRAGNADPAYSASGRKIVFSHKVGTHHVIDVMRADGSQKREVTKGHHDFTPAFSPSGEKIVFSRAMNSNGHGHSELMSVRSDGTHLTQLTHSNPALEEKHTQPSYSPDGKRIVYGLFAESPTTFAVDMIKADGTNANFHRLNDVDEDATFAPSGKRVLFDKSFAVPPQLATADLSGEHVKDLTNNQDPDFDYFSPSYAPNGKKIVFVGDLGISVMNPDGTGITQLTDDGKSREPDWGPRPGG